MGRLGSDSSSLEAYAPEKLRQLLRLDSRDGHFGKRGSKSRSNEGAETEEWIVAEREVRGMILTGKSRLEARFSGAYIAIVGGIRLQQTPGCSKWVVAEMEVCQRGDKVGRGNEQIGRYVVNGTRMDAKGCKELIFTTP